MAPRTAPKPVQDDAPAQWFSNNQFGTWNTRSIRTGLQQEDFSYVRNFQQIGDANIRTTAPPLFIQNISGGSVPSDVWSKHGWYAHIGTTDWLLVSTQNDDLWAFDQAGTGVKIASATPISDIEPWDNTQALLVGPSGYYSWPGSGPLINISANAIYTLTLTSVAGTFLVGETASLVTGTGVVVSWDSTTGVLVIQNVTGGDPVITSIVSGVTSGALGAIVSAVPAGVPQNGDWIAVYQSRVWIAKGRVISFSGPGDYTGTSWDVAVGAGTFAIEDSTLVGNITRLMVANGYMYIFGPTSIDIVDNVYVPSGVFPPTPLFTRINIDPINGTPFSYSIVMFGRLILFYNIHGVHALSGVQIKRISEDIDGTIQLIDPAAPYTVSAGVGVSNNILTATFLVSWFDPTGPVGVSRQSLLAFFDGKWFDYVPQVNRIGACFSAQFSGEPISVIAENTYVSPTSGLMNLSSCFRLPTGTMPRVLQTAFWPLGSAIHTKQVIRFGVEGSVIDLAYSVSAVVDAEPGAASSAPVTFLPNTVRWINAFGQEVTWVNSAGDEVSWVLPGYSFAYSDVDQYGKYIGITVYGTTGRAVISGFNLEYRQRATWAI